MWKRTVTAIGLALAVAATLVGAGRVGSAQAAAAATQHEHLIVTDYTAQASFENQGKTTVTSVAVDASIEVRREAGTQHGVRRVVLVDLTYEQRDLATGTVLQRYYGETTQGVELRFGPQLRRATLDARVPVTDDHGRTFTVTLHVDWQATGPLQREKPAHEYHSRGAYRQATASGTLNERVIPSASPGPYADLIFTTYVETDG